jgi:hypothetical protein
MVNPKSNVKSMASQQLRAYFRETRDEEAFREILSRGLDDEDKAAACAFKAWQGDDRATSLTRSVGAWHLCK